MPDSLKTRLWDAEEKTMHYTDFVITSTGYVAKLQPMYELEEDENGDKVEIQSEKEFMINQTDFEFNKKMIVMKCTGLEDENKQLVYEGDVVRFYSLVGYATFEIKFNEEKAAFGCEDEETDFCEFGQLFDASNYIAILGNIYENPELLERGCDV